MAHHEQLAPESPFALMSEPEVRAWYAYMKVQLRLRYEMNRQLRDDSGISLADYDVLVALTSESGGRMRMAALATRIGWERSRASHHCRTLTDRGLVSMMKAVDDRRATDVGLTELGWTTLRDASPAHVELVRRMFFADLGPEALEPLTQALETIYDSVIRHGTLPRPEDHP